MIFRGGSFESNRGRQAHLVHHRGSPSLEGRFRHQGIRLVLTNDDPAVYNSVTDGRDTSRS